MMIVVVVIMVLWVGPLDRLDHGRPAPSEYQHCGAGQK